MIDFAVGALGLGITKYLLVALLFVALDRRLDTAARQRLGAALGSGAVEAADALLAAVAGRRLFARRHLGAVLLLSLAGYPILIALALAWVPAAVAILAPAPDSDAAFARGSVLGQLGQFWLFFAPVATLFALAGCQGATALLRGRRRGALLLAPALVSATLAALFGTYLATILIVAPPGVIGPVETLAVAAYSLGYALAFEVTAGIYAYAAFLPATLALAAAGAAWLPTKLGARSLVRPSVVTLGGLALGDVFAGNFPT